MSGPVAVVRASGQARRIGTETSETRAALIQAAEKLMLEAGYAAVTSRRVAACAGLKPQLVHYYFRTMDDLFLALYRSFADQARERVAAALCAAQPLWALWDLNRDARGTALTMEFVALANHRNAIRAEIAASAEGYRAAQHEGLSRILAGYGVDTRFPPLVFTVLMSSVSHFMVIEEEALGITTGHAQTVAFVEGLLTQLEGERVLGKGN